jgi:hypothetical protein
MRLTVSGVSRTFSGVSGHVSDGFAGSKSSGAWNAMTLVSLHSAKVFGATGGEFAQAPSIKVSSNPVLSLISPLLQVCFLLQCFGLNFKFSDFPTLKPRNQGDADPGQHRDQLLKEFGPDHAYFSG